MDRGQLILLFLLLIVICFAVVLSNGVTPEYPYSPELHGLNLTPTTSITTTPTPTP